MKTWHLSLLILIQTFVVFSATNYGGVRSSDSEIVFREAEAIAHSDDISIARELESWPGFGVARGRDGRWYSIYPPVESFVLAPVILFIESVVSNERFESLKFPVSHYDGFGVRSVRAGILEKSGRVAGVRFYASIFDVGVSVLGVFVFWLILLRLTNAPLPSYVVTTLYALGTFVWSYAGSLFSEPLATLFVLLSFYLTLVGTLLSGLFAGFFLALAVGTHTTAILFVPFFFCALFIKGKRRISSGLAIAWGGGFGVVSLFLAYYNWVRFGDVFESGRNLSSDNPLTFVSPLSPSFINNVLHLLTSPGKGLFIICPAVFVGIFTWRYFHREFPRLSRVLIATIITRVIFIAHYADWHAGFGLGPRYFYMIVPFLLIPCAFWLKKIEMKPTTRWEIAIGIWLLIIEQWYFALGEIFSFYDSAVQAQSAKGIDIFLHDRIYRDWQFAPFMYFLEGHRGPYLLQTVQISTLMLWVVGALILLGLTVAITYCGTFFGSKSSVTVGKEL